MILRAGNNGSFVIVSADVVRTIGGYARDLAEAGGILLGHYRTPHIEIVACSEPMPCDLRSFAAFDRRDPGHQMQALERWRESGRTMTFVGEWHTHPEEFPLPSSTDLRTWREARKASQVPLVFIIRGYTGWWFGRSQDNGRIARLRGMSLCSLDE